MSTTDARSVQVVFQESGLAKQLQAQLPIRQGLSATETVGIQTEDKVYNTSHGVCSSTLARWLRTS